jgi:hypothetical protein
VSNIKFKIICTGFTIVLCLLLFSFVFVTNSIAYYGLARPGLYGCMLYGGLGLYGLGGCYGMGMYGLGGLYGGLSRLYNLGKLTSFGGLYGLYGPKNFYGLGNLCGLYGFYGLGGFLGVSGKYNTLNGIGGLLGSLGLLSNLGPLNINSQNIIQATPVMTAEQAGTWIGTWSSVLSSRNGIMNMTLVEDALTGTLSGEVNLLLNDVTNSIPANVTGFFAIGVNIPGLSTSSLGISGLGSGGIGTLVLIGDNQGFLSTISTTLLLITKNIPIYIIRLNCIMTSPISMVGTYEVEDLNTTNVDSGEFELILTTPVI